MYFKGWQDLRLSWDPKDFGGLEEMRMPIQSIWSPDIAVYNRSVLNSITIGLHNTRAIKIKTVVS